MAIQYVTPSKLRDYIDLDSSSLRKLRQNNQLIEGVHYFTQSKTSILYNLQLIESFVRNRQNPEAHLKDVEQWQKTLH